VNQPTIFGQYLLLERVSVGGMAEVFRARPQGAPDADRYLALKRILPHLAEDDEFIKMFVDEAKLCVQLRHPNIVHIFELGQVQSAYYILMEYISGQDLLALQKRLRRERLIMSVAQACYIMMELSRGLDHAHKSRDEHGRPLRIIHRDISPQNVLVTYSGSVKLIDFGVAKAAVQSTRTQVGVLKGKFGYMSPEQIRGESIDHRSDIFSVGVVLWELLTNRRLFHGDNEFEIFQKVRDAQVEPPSLRNPQIPAEVDRIVMRALSADPNTRYQWCEELAADLERFLQSLKPVYGQRHMSEWMGRFFAEELIEERQKRESFKAFRTAQDVHKQLHDNGMLPPPDGEEDFGEATRVWSGDPASLRRSGEHAAAAANAFEEGEGHTVVAAGGFSLDEFLALQDGDLLELDDADLIEDSDAFTDDTPPDAFEPLDLSDLVELHHAQVAEAPASLTLQGLSDSFAVAAIRTITQPRAQQPVAPVRLPPQPISPARKAAAAAAVVVFIALLVGVIVVATREPAKAPEAPAPAPVVAAVGALVISITPSEELEILVDGIKRGAEAPVSLKELEPGPHMVVVRREGYSPVQRLVDVPAGGFVPLEIVLEPIEEP
jgi:eukaryotic-like serine/threonine-protein kinase